MKDFPLTIYFVDDNGNLREKKCVRDGGFNACGEKPNCTQNECAECNSLVDPSFGFLLLAV